VPAVRPLAPRAGPALVALYVLAGSALLGIGTDVRRIVVIGQYLDARTQLDDALQADQLVALASFVGLAAIVVAAVLAGRWLLALRAGRSVLGDSLGGLGVVWAWLGLSAAALVAVLITRAGLSAQTPQEVRDADVLDVAGQVLVLLAAGTGIVAVNRVTARHDDAAAAAGVLAAPEARRPRGRRRAEPEDPVAAEAGGGLRVVSEDEARGQGPSGHGAP
jgi:hypothetical protein